MHFGKIFIALSLLTLLNGCTFYKAGIKNDPQIFKDVKGIDTYTASYFGCEMTYANNKPLEKLPLALWQDKDDELWLMCKSTSDSNYRNGYWRRVHLGPAPFEKVEDPYDGSYDFYLGGDKLAEWSRDLTYVPLYKCGSNEASDQAGRRPQRGDDQMLCASTTAPRREIRLKEDGTNILVEMADFDGPYRKIRQVIDGDLEVDQLAGDGIPPVTLLAGMKNELLEKIMVGPDRAKARAIYTKLFRLPAEQSDQLIDNTLSTLPTSCSDQDLGGHAQKMNSLCVAYLLQEGADVNAPGKLGTPPLFLALHGVKVYTKETLESVRIVRMLIAHGADLQYRDNPQPLVFRRKMTPREYLTASRTDGMFDLKAPHAPWTLALFSDSRLLEENATWARHAKRAEEMGMKVQEYRQKLSRIEELRKQGTFEASVEAFTLSRQKEDFQQAQKLASSPEEKQKLEYLAVLATADKKWIFDVSTSLNDVHADAMNNEDTSDSLLFVLKFDSKKTFNTFMGKTTVKKSKQSPFDFKGAYRVTAKYTLAIPIKNTTKVDFIIKTQQVTSDTIYRTVTKTFTVRPNNFSDSDTLDFGSVEIAGSTNALGGIGKVERTLAGNPTLSVDIVKVEMAND